MNAIAEKKMEISPEELIKIQAYLRSKFDNSGLAVRPRSQTTDSIEVLLNGEFIGVVYKDINQLFCNRLNFRNSLRSNIKKSFPLLEDSSKRWQFLYNLLVV